MMDMLGVAALVCALAGAVLAVLTMVSRTDQQALAFAVIAIACAQTLLTIRLTRRVERLERSADGAADRPASGQA
jgi:ABC-type uncharacterized transport system permease subunit